MSERFILAGVSLSGHDDTEASLSELSELLATAGGETVEIVIQSRERPHPGTYLGKGKIMEIRELVEETKADGLICDDELSPAQLRNLGDALSCKILDRTGLILDIFAERAVTSEGKLQVELAQLKYRAARLTGFGNELSRLGGGIGTRGPGEKKLETDRRLIRERISHLKRELSDMDTARETARKQRSENPVPIIAIAGYTNAGKSTLLNTLTRAGVLEEDKLFATLDPTTRSLTLKDGSRLLFTDTVGFIRKLPHHLIEAFRSTLLEAKYADLILHVADSANPDIYAQMQTVYETLEQLGISDKPIITAFNKMDLGEGAMKLRDFRADACVHISAKTGEGLEQLLETVMGLLRQRKKLVERVFPYEEAGKIQRIRKYGQLLCEEYRPEGIYIRAYVPKEIFFD